MSYIGMHMNECTVIPLDWHDAWLVVVSGDGPNVCGHALLRAGPRYLHIAGIYARPYFMDEAGYLRYLSESEKTELFRRKVFVTDINGAQRKVEALSVRPWHWLGIPNNCVTYVEEIFAAGGANEAIFSNCPVRWR
jgi:hypothetical protein